MIESLIGPPQIKRALELLHRILRLAEKLIAHSRPLAERGLDPRSVMKILSDGRLSGIKGPAKRYVLAEPTVPFRATGREDLVLEEPKDRFRFGCRLLCLPLTGLRSLALDDFGLSRPRS